MCGFFAPSPPYPTVFFASVNENAVPAILIIFHVEENKITTSFEEFKGKYISIFHGNYFEPLVQSGTVVFATRFYLPQKYFAFRKAIRQRTVN